MGNAPIPSGLAGWYDAAMFLRPDPATLDALPLQVWTARPIGTLDFVNACVAKYFSVSRERVLEHGWKDLCHPLDLIAANQAWAESLASGDPYEVEFRLLRGHDNRFRWHLARAEAMRSGDGRIIGWIGTNTDVDAVRRGAEIAEFEAASLRSRLASILGEQLPAR